MASTPDQTTRPRLRRDAEANRERILCAATAAFAELGLEASVEEIATRAGVGMGTLYRRFPTKAALVDAIFEAHLDELERSAHDALADPDAWAGFCHFLERSLALQTKNRGFGEILALHLRGVSLIGKARARLAPLLQRLIERAQADGALRPDIAYQDISVLLWTTGRVVDATRDFAPNYWKRQLALTLDSLRADNASPLPGPTLTSRQHTKAMEQLARQLHLIAQPAPPPRDEAQAQHIT